MECKSIKIQEPPFALPMDSIIHGRYIINHVLGLGGFGITYQGQDLKTGKFIAIKEYYPDGLVSREPGTVKVNIIKDNYGFIKGKEKFLQEARIIYHCHNPHVLGIYNLFEENQTAYYVMEFLEGRDLMQYIQLQGGRIKWSELKYIIFQVMDALEYVHREGIIHRDISPDNIYLCLDNNARLIDFGTARSINANKSLSIIIKKGYAPPEQYMRHGKQGPWTDVYALGGTIYRALTGQKPIDALDRVHGEALTAIKILQPDVPDYVSKAVEKAMCLNEEERYSSIRYFRDALKETITGLGVFTSKRISLKENISEYIHSWAKTNPKLTGVSGVYAGQRFNIDQDIIMGRSANSCNIVFPSDTVGVSKIHCQICLNVNGHKAIIDCDSTFGTFLNGIKLHPGKWAILQSGSEIRLGNGEKFIFEL